ncbi:ABC-2 type transporter-domain-containing protein [Xylariales sp. AK1849]|nr:ABC-2 type transporter-domain-containing protein [Xylariales sp. AK1849]
MDSEGTLTDSDQSRYDATSDEDTWALKGKIETVRGRDQRSGFPPRELGVTWKNLTVQAISADAAIHENVALAVQHSQACPTVSAQTAIEDDPRQQPWLRQTRGDATCTRPAGIRMHDAIEQPSQQEGGQIIMNTEEELFFPTLTRRSDAGFCNAPEGSSMGIEHTHDTKVGNEYVRGVSGGERKRVSIIEALATRGSIFCWDNSTRGLDASTALEYTKAVRALTDVLGLASIVTLYQAGNGIYNLFDKVLVLDGGKEIYYGPMKEARPFMEKLGFVCQDGANVADYLTGVTVPTERQIAEQYEGTFPRNADMLRTEYEKSPIHPQMVSEYDYPTTEEAKEKTQLFQQSVASEKHRQLPASSPLTVSFAAQVKACVIRQYQIIWGDKATFFIKQISTLVQALISGSLFYNAPDNSGGLFVKSGALFFSLLYNSLLSMSEVTESFTGRPVLVKHKHFGLFHPAAFCIAQIAADIPVILFQISIFSIVLYFMVGLTMSAGPSSLIG